MRRGRSERTSRANSGSKFGLHIPVGSDGGGTEIPIVIRILPDGRLYTHDITPGLVPVLMALCPDHPGLQARAVALRRFRSDPSS